ncbi:serine hydrolase domain-containing protein [Cohnella thailandensis]|uniref:Beta-lactamase family protein n=1 Tax=Cohnella thailandensis TaxID=557557 RepID=A0A841TAZ8_9BACL|nr:serine hydrolase domain-containing protein [Cohnella thailandensis]MBB6638401.1 beta-lactamase family protein [Cohnella thailandensis]MBP1977121.1 CubicO group peptidase (beta-lactamase class C family) [Cohnella thailandensis]
MEKTLAELFRQPRVRKWAEKPNHRLSVGIIQGDDRTVWEKGAPRGSGISNGLYEIGSITKTMVGLILAIGEKEGRWNSAERLADLVPEWKESPFARETSLLQLATHTSGLPVVPSNLRATINDRMNPYSGYTERHLNESVLSEKKRQTGSHRYSNYGFGLLGWALARRLGMSLNDMIGSCIAEPFGMTNTGVASSGSLSASLVPVYRASGKPTRHWDFSDALGGAGAVRSTIDDMLLYLEAHLNESEEEPMGRAIALAVQEHQALMPKRGIGVGYAWMRYREKDGTLTHWHNGGTYGSSSFISFNRENRTGFVVLSNYGSSAWSQLAPMLGIKPMSVDGFASMLNKELYELK